MAPWLDVLDVPAASAKSTAGTGDGSASDAATSGRLIGADTSGVRGGVRVENRAGDRGGDGRVDGGCDTSVAGPSGAGPSGDCDAPGGATEAGAVGVIGDRAGAAASGHDTTSVNVGTSRGGGACRDVLTGPPRAARWRSRGSRSASIVRARRHARRALPTPPRSHAGNFRNRPVSCRRG